jgi:hypothetical protein
MKIVLYMKNPRLRASLEARRAGSFFEFFVTNPPHKEALSAAAAFIVPDG